MEDLSDLELHRLLLKHGFPNIPVTETTRNILRNRLKNYLKNKSLKKDTNTKPLTFKYNTQSIEKKLPHLRFYNGKQYQLFDDGIQRKPSPQIFARSPISSAVSNGYSKKNQHDPDNYDIRSSCFDRACKFGAVDRLLSFRDSIIKKSTLPCSEPKKKCSYSPNKSSNIFMQCNSKATLFGKCSRQGFVSHVLVLVLILFFMSLASIYAFISLKNTKAINSLSTQSWEWNHVKCSTELLADCIEKNKLPFALNLYQKLLHALQQRAIEHFCIDSSVSSSISITEFFDVLRIKWNSNGSVLKLFQDIDHLIKNNPQSKISVIDNNGKLFMLNTVNDVSIKNFFFILTKPHLPLLCVIKTKLRQFFTIVGMGAIIGLIFIFFYIVVIYVKQQQQIKAKTTEAFVSKIINELQDVLRKKKTNELTVNHLRDSLLPIVNRKSMLYSWNKALQILETNDSRVQFAIKNQNGESVKTICWVGSVSDKLTTTMETTNFKQWQSPAFDNRHQIFHPPTSCLKIRHMFDSSDVGNPNLKQLINSAIIAKVSPQCKNFDIQLDMQSCCVYVRCQTEKDAGAIHNEINGWWFDNRLVSIKFLRLERYLCRFPKSILPCIK